MGWIGRYQELIVNGLDLASFCFVTPKLLRFVRPVLLGGIVPMLAYWFLTTLVAAVGLTIFFAITAASFALAMLLEKVLGESDWSS